MDAAEARGSARRSRRPTLSWTLSFYVGKQTLYGLLAVFALFAALAFVIDGIEHLRRAGNRDGVGVDVALVMTALRTPFLVQNTMPFALLFAAMAVFRRLTRNQELVAMRAAGVSVWQFLAPAVFVAMSVGAVSVGIFNPMSAALLTAYERMDQRWFDGEDNPLALSSGGLWLRQKDGERDVVMKATALSSDPVTLGDVILFVFEDRDRFVARVDAERAVLEPGAWAMSEVVQTDRDGARQMLETYRLATSLSRGSIQESLQPPETISFWALPAYAELLERIGFAARSHWLHFHSLLAQPLLFAAMVFIGAVFSLRLARRGGAAIFVAGGLLSGFAFYILSDVALALGLSGRLPPPMAAWTPAAVVVLLGAASLFHLEDG